MSKGECQVHALQGRVKERRVQPGTPECPQIHDGGPVLEVSPGRRREREDNTPAISTMIVMERGGESPRVTVKIVGNQTLVRLLKRGSQTKGKRRSGPTVEAKI